MMPALTKVGSMAKFRLIFLSKIRFKRIQSHAGTDGREFLPQPSDAVGKRPRRNVKPPEVYKDEFFTKKNKRGEKPVPSSLVEESEATLPSSLEENLSGAPKAKGKPGRNPSKQGRKPKAQQSSQLENEVPSSDVETEMFEPHEPTAKPSTKKGRKVWRPFLNRHFF